jgi:hypothetical protein
MSTLAESRKVTSNTKYYSQVAEADKRKNIQAQYNEFMNMEVIYKTKEVPDIKL